MKNIWNNLDDFLFNYRFWIGGALIIIIIAGLGIIGYEKYRHMNSNKESQTITELKNQNESLRQQLSQTSTQEIAGTATENQTDKININTADAAELDKIPGIGPARAADIITYRESHGGFKSIEEIKNIKGIGDKTFESMKDLITVGE